MTTELFSKLIRLETLKMVYNTKGSHIGSALSYVDILSILYNEFLEFDPIKPMWDQRDRFILSKGHACSSLYACLAIKGFFSLNELKKYGKNNSNLMNHVSHKVPGIEFSTGSLGHGLPYAVGISKALKINGNKSKVFVLIGDGELAEGSNFEAMLFASHHNLDNLILIIDNNNLQSLTTINQTLNLYPLYDKFNSFGWDFLETDGHNLKLLRKSLNFFSEDLNGKPKVIVCKTIKGKGVSFMENKVSWHYKSPNEKEFKEAIKEIKNA